MGRLSIRKIHSSLAASRGTLRKQLHRASCGDRQSFQVVVDHYLNFVTEFLVVTGYHDENRIRSQTRTIFHKMWLGVGHTRRVSDFERQLFVFLKQIPVNVAPFQDLLAQKLVMLNSLQRFLVVARDMESWTSKNLILATRIPRQELITPLYDAWKIMVGFKAKDLDYHTNECMEKIVENMEGAFDPSEQQRLCKKVKENAIASGFKADCLNLRCELVELRQNARWTLEQKTTFFNELIEDLALITPVKPDLTERLKNQFSYQCVSPEVPER